MTRVNVHLIGLDPPSADVVSVVVAALALAVSIYVALRQRRDAGRANLTAEWETKEQVVVVNHGPGAARDLSAKATNEHDAERFGLTATYVGLYQPMRMTVIRSWGESAPEIELRWKDNRLRQQHITVTLGEQPSARTPAKPKSGIEAEVRAVAQDEVSAELSALSRRIGRRMF